MRGSTLLLVLSLGFGTPVFAQTLDPEAATEAYLATVSG